MNQDALRAASTRLIMAQDAVNREDKDGALRHLLGLQAALAEMHEPRRRRRTDTPLPRLTAPAEDASLPSLPY